MRKLQVSDLKFCVSQCSAREVETMKKLQRLQILFCLILMLALTAAIGSMSVQMFFVKAAAEEPAA